MKKLTALTISIGVLAASVTVHAQYPGPQGGAIFKADCSHSPQTGRAVACFDTTQLAWYGWNATAQAFQPVSSAGSVPTPVTSGAFLQDNGVGSYVESTLSQDIACAVGGVCTVTGFNSVPLVGAPTASTAGQAYITNASNQFVPGNIPADPDTTVGQIPALSSAAPNVYSAVTPGTQGTLMTSNGATSLPSYQANEAPFPLDFALKGAIANSTVIYRVCPVSLRVAPGFATSYPFIASQATIGTDPSEQDVYTLTDVTNSNASVGTATVTTGGAWTFATTGCSSSFDGTQGSTAWARAGSATTTQNVTVPAGASSGDGGILGCYSAGSVTWTTPSGWTPITGGAATGGTSSGITYEKILAGGDIGNPVTCTASASNAMSAAVFTMKGVPNGEIVDAVSATRFGSQTTCVPATITTNHNGELVIQGCMTGGNSTLASWSPINTNVASSVAGVGAQYIIQGSSGATGAATGTWTAGAELSFGFQVALLNSATSCTLCTAGHQMKLAGPASGTNGDDLDISFVGVQ